MNEVKKYIECLKVVVIILMMGIVGSVWAQEIIKINSSIFNEPDYAKVNDSRVSHSLESWQNCDSFCGLPFLASVFLDRPVDPGQNNRFADFSTEQAKLELVRNLIPKDYWGKYYYGNNDECDDFVKGFDSLLEIKAGEILFGAIVQCNVLKIKKNKNSMKVSALCSDEEFYRWKKVILLKKVDGAVSVGDHKYKACQ